MSVNIIVNGKYKKTSCERNDLLNDPERVKKENENERRKMRIQQVRDVSKNIAKKMRTNLELEKEKQLKKIEQIKAQEMEMWRQNVLAQKEKDFRSSIFQIGTAHRAAQLENTNKNKKKVTKSKKAFNHSKQTASTSKSVDKENLLKNANVQTDITGKCYPKPKQGLKTKNNINFESKSKSTALNTSSKWDDSNSMNSSSEDSSESSLLSLSDSEDVSKCEEANKKSVSVLLEEKEEEESDSSLIDTSNVYKHSKVGSNKHSNRIVSKITPKPLKSKPINKEEEEAKSITSTTKPRFTQISDIIRQQKSSSDTIQQPTATTSRFHKSPIKSPSSHLHKSLTEGLSKSPGNSRPVSTHTTTGTQASKNSSSRSTNTRVQFYDYNNKFQKQYDQPNAVVEVHESETDLNAMERAAIEVKLRESREAEMNKLRQKSSERCQKAIEREQVRRACEELSAKLDALTKQRQVLPSDNQHFASHRLQQVTKEKETKLNNAVEDILKRPAIITCPVIDRTRPERLESTLLQPRNQMNGLNVNSAFTQNGSNSLNSSDSCHSILLGYVDDRSKKIADDIQKFKTQNQETDNAKAGKLQNLLNRINKLRENLMNELEKCSIDQTSDKDHVQTMMDSISNFRKEHEHILIDDSAIDSIKKRENDLKKKEAVLEKKVKEFYEIHKAAKRQEQHLKTVQEQSNKTTQKSQDPIEQKQFEEPTKLKKSPNKIIEKHITNDQVSSKYQKNCDKEKEPHEKQSKQDKQLPRKERIRVIEQIESSSSEDEFEDERELIVDQKPVKIVIKVKGDSKTKRAKKLPSKSPRKLSTLIQSPALKKTRPKISTVRSVDSNSTSYRSLPSKINNNVDKILKNIPSTSKKQVIENHSETLSEDENIKFKKKSSNLNPLMAHYVQRLLGMSRTSINALGVSSSEIDTPSNSIINTTANLSAAETEKLASSRLENVEKFIVDNYSFIGELEESLRQSNSTDSSLKTVEVAWKKALKEEQNKKKDPPTEKKKPSLKNSSKKPKPPINKVKEPISLVDKSTQMTDTCTQRIAELTEMINKVRKEKQKILETTLSSASENGRNSTEYLDLPADRRNNSDESTSRILDSQLVKSIDNLPTQSSEMAPPPLLLQKDKLTGMSRDSGISLSRPITVQETRESPIDDMRQMQSSTESLSVQFKKPRPPISITRYSPQLPEDVPHELSTIFEIDTPATSRLNTSVNNNAPGIQDPEAQINSHKVDQIPYKKFPTFEHYAKINNLDMTQFDPEFTLQFEKEFNEFINLAKEGMNVNYEEFTSFSKYLAKSSSSENKEAAEELLASLKLANLSFKKFPTRKEYLDKMGISNSDLLDSQSLDNIEKKNKEYKGSSSMGSSSTNLQNNHEAEISGIIQFTAGSTSTDEKSVNLEEDLKKIGIKWPSAMKKKTLESQALSSSTSSNIEQSTLTSRRKNNNANQVLEKSLQKGNQTAHNTTAQTEDGGQQLNLRDFLKKELLKRTATSSSFSFSDDSVASSILRSILGSITPSGGQKQSNDAAVPTLDRHKTSTPMASQSLSSAKIGSKSQGGTSSVQLFSGESRLSSVHFINSSYDVNNTAVKNS
ncbi:interaptin isoform X3 [Episyrphus balteatus]|uniref:interaptin isoform X3 n=1 Tax=Episyrphus balteatus TaxID=286459 RepID=UPI00248572FA|nr:interaptin isoform X3 [Episyrphus balteatus]